MKIRLVRSAISHADLVAWAGDQFGDMVKAVVDLGTGAMAVGGELHADAEALLLAEGARQEDLWGINLYPGRSDEDWIEFDAMINIRPAQGNSSRDVRDPATRERILALVHTLVPGSAP